MELAGDNRDRNEEPPDTASPTASRSPTPTRTPEPTVASFPYHLNGLQGSTTPDASIEGSYSRIFTQSVEDEQTVYSIEIPKALYEYYQNRHRVPDYGSYAADGYDEVIIERIASDLEEYGERNDLPKPEVVNHAIAFTQNLEYTLDVNQPYDEYPKYPVETLVDEGGDCEDTSILLAAILEKLGFGAVLLKIPDAQHMAVGVLGDESLPGLYYEYDDARYYYLETTGSGWQVGQVPDAVQESDGKAEILEISGYPVLVFKWVISVPSPGEVHATFRIGNFGDSIAKDGTVVVEFENREGDVVSQSRETFQDITPEGEEEFSFEVSPPPEDEELLTRVAIFLDGNLHDFTESQFQSPL